MYPSNLFVADLDGDGNVDAITTGYHSTTLSWGDGMGDFGPDLPLDSALDIPFAADIDGDGRLDIASWTQSNQFCFMRNLGQRTFQASVCTAPPPMPSTPVVGDFNEDGKVDFVTGGQVYLGQGDGTFVAGATLAGAQVGLAAALHAGGHLDLVANGEDPLTCGSGLLVFPGRGDGTFGPPDTYAAPSFEFAAAARSTGGPLPDLILIGRAPNDLGGWLSQQIGEQWVYVMRNDGTGALSLDAAPYPTTDRYVAATGDLGGKGRDDVILLGELGTRLRPR